MQTNQINIQELTQMLKKVVWDYYIQENQLLDIYLDKTKSNSISSKELKTKLLNGFSWYKLIDVLGFDEAKKLLQDDIIKGIYPKSYRETIYNASKILNS